EGRLTLASPVPVVEGVMVNAGGGLASYSVADDGSLVAIAGASGQKRTLVWVSRAGAVESILGEPQTYAQRSVGPSPDQSTVALVIDNGPNRDIWTFDLKRHVLTRLTFLDHAADPIWTPDGRSIVFSNALPDGKAALFIVPADGSGSPEPLLEAAPRLVRPDSVSSDGKTLAFERYDQTSRWDIWIMPLTGDRKPQSFLATPFNEFGAAFSPDGRWIAYASDDSAGSTGQTQVYVRPFPGPGGRWQVSTTSGISPAWRADGRELVFANNATASIL